MITAPSFMQASIDSHSSTWLPSTSSTRMPRLTPCAASQPASREELSDSCAKVYRAWLPSSSISRSASWPPRSAASTPSK